jgi:excisionase family DNA binding protein
MPIDPLQLLTIDQVAALLNVHRRTVDRMIKNGDLEVFRWHSTTRVYRTELTRFLRAHTSRARRKQRTAPRPAVPPAAQLPVPDPPTPEPTGPLALAPPEPVAATARTIVVLEDDENIRRFLAYALTAEGYDVRPCASYDELVEACEQTRATLVIADAWGESAAVLEPGERESILALARRCPTIMATGREWAERADPAELGLVAIFRKPFELDDLLAIVRSQKP